MSKQITLNSFEELAEVLRSDQVASDTPEQIKHQAPQPADAAC